MSQQPSYVIDQTLSACSTGLFDANKRPSICLLAGLIVGGVSALIAGWIGFLNYGHQLNDPIYLSISISSIFRGFLYFNWTAFLTPLVFAFALGLFAGLTAKLLAKRAGRRLHADESGSAARVAAIISSAPIWIIEVSSFQVFLMYALATWLSIIFARNVAKRITH